MFWTKWIPASEAASRWGCLTKDHGNGMKTYLEFDTPEGRWRPDFSFHLNLIGYFLYPNGD